MSLYLACGLTMAIETAYFFLIGYRGREFVTVCLAANAATNLALNLILRQAGMMVWVIIVLELLAVWTEYAVYSFVQKPSKALLMHTVTANLLSLSIGGVFMKLLF